MHIYYFYSEKNIKYIFLEVLLNQDRFLGASSLSPPNQHYIGILWNENVYYQKFWENG